MSELIGANDLLNAGIAVVTALAAVAAALHLRALSRSRKPVPVRIHSRRGHSGK